MKILLLVLLGVLPAELLWAAASAPVMHSHGGRVHSHPLPAVGVAHRHGNSAPGVLVGSSPPPSSITGSYTPPTTQYSKADTRCRRNDPDCNVCAVNVQQQFNRAAAGQISWQSKSWRFDWNKQYPPQQVRPLAIFKGNKEFLLGIPTTHVQGFVRTNSSRFPYAGSHSHTQQGGIFLLGQNKNGDKYLAALLKANSRHPSGVHAFGKYLVYGESGRVYLQDLRQPAGKAASLRLPGPQANFGGGIGLVKLQSGDYLMVTTGPGKQDARPRYNRFYQLSGTSGRMASIRYLGQSEQTKPPQWPQGFRFAENMSLVTECGSGDIYAVHTTGDQNGLTAISGNGYWRLSKLAQRGQQLTLQPVNAFINTQNIASCSMRATATVHVNPANRLEFYCHGYAKNPKGTLMNVLGKSTNKFKFKLGIPR